MVDRPVGGASSNDAPTEIKTFLIADIRGYTLFTQERGDEASGKLAMRFAELAREGVESRGGTVIEFRGDEALAVFGSPRQAIRAAVDLQARFVEETITDPSLPLPVGIGIDAGEAVAVEGGYRGGALNLAARLCGQAGPGEILASQEAVHMARKVEGVTYVDRGQVHMKGISEPVHVIRVVSEEGDPAMLLKPYVRAPTPRRSRRRPLAVGVALVSVLAVVAILLPVVLRNGGNDAGFEPGLALINAKTGALVASIPRSVVAGPCGATFADGHFWVSNCTPNSFVEIDETGKILDQFAAPLDEVGAIAVQGDTMWVAQGLGSVVIKIDIPFHKEIDRVDLDKAVGDGTGGPGSGRGMALGAGSLWVGRDVGEGEVVRLDPATLKVQHVYKNLEGGYINVAYGDDAIWTADNAGMRRIDPQTNRVTHIGLSGEVWNVAVGGGFGWSSDGSKGVVYEADESGRVTHQYATGLGAGQMSFSDGTLWVANSDVGTVTGIDAITGEQTTYRAGHPVGALAAGEGVVLLSVEPGLSYEDTINALTGNVAKLFAPDSQLGQNDPALDESNAAFQIEYATCAKLLSYPDEPAPAGWKLQPEVARSMPAVSSDGRTYTFIVRSGYEFSPPSNQPVTAETFRYSIERALSPKLGDDTPGPRFIDDIEGEQAFRDGTAQSISGLRAKGDELTITLAKPSPTFLQRLSMPFFCPVPTDTPVLPGTAERGGIAGGTIPSAGPYYVANHINDEYVILKRNPYYEGPRPQALDAIALREAIDPGLALRRIQVEGWDGIVNMDDPLLDPSGALAKQWGPESAPAEKNDQRYYAVPSIPFADVLAFNASRAPFSDPTIRRAAALALDRSALAAAFEESPSTQLVPPDQPGYRDTGGPSMSAADVRRARALMNGRRTTAILASSAGCDPCDQWAEAVKSQLAEIGITVRIQRLADVATTIRKPGAPFDLFNAGSSLPYPDTVTFLTGLLGGVVDYPVPDSWLPPAVRSQLDRASSLRGEARVAAGATLAARLATDEIPATGFGHPVNGQFFSARVGCRVFPPFGYGIDLAAMCVKG